MQLILPNDDANYNIKLSYGLQFVDMTTKQRLIGQLRAFAENLRSFKRLFDKYPLPNRNSSLLLQKTQEQTKQFNAIIIPSNELIEQILNAFKNLYEERVGNVGIDKLKKQFDNLLKQYKDNLKKYEQLEKKEVESLRRTMTQQLQKFRKSKIRNSIKEDDRGETPQIQMLEVNQGTLNCELMIQIKQKQIKIAHERMKDALRVHEDMKNLVVSQGERLNEVEANIDDANRNVHEAKQNLVEAQKQHISSKKKKMCIVAIIVVVVLVIVVPIAIHFG